MTNIGKISIFCKQIYSFMIPLKTYGHHFHFLKTLLFLLLLLLLLLLSLIYGSKRAILRSLHYA